MARYEVAPTKTNLLKIKQELKFSEEGYELLDQKRSILMVELMGLIDATKSLQRDVEESLNRAFKTLSETIKKVGRKELSFISNTVDIKSRITLSQRKVMGVPLPVVNISYEENAPYYNLMNTSFWIDETIIEFKEVLKLIGKLAETRVSLMRLAMEVKKTIRKVNALEKIAIPDYKETIKFIEERLEEAEREAFFLMKVIKKRLEKKKKSGSKRYE